MINWMNTPAILTAIITGAIALIGIIIQMVTFFVKHKYESKNNFENVLKEKIEKIYCPLLIELYKGTENSCYITNPVKDLIAKNGYLLSDSLLSDILELAKVEEDYLAKSNDEVFIQEHKNFKEKVFLQLRKDFDALQDIYNMNFKIRMSKFSTPWYRKIGLGIIIFCISVTILLIIFVLVLSGLVWVLKGVPPASKNTPADILMYIWMGISALTSVIGLPAGVIWGFDKLTDVFRKYKKRYLTREYVPETTKYYCRICNQEYHLYKNSRFPLCRNHNFKQEIESIFKLYSWAMSDENYYQRMERKNAPKKNNAIKQNLEQDIEASTINNKKKVKA